MLELFSTLWRSLLRARAHRRTAAMPPACGSADLLAHPLIAAMSERELADLPFPRGRAGNGAGSGPRSPAHCREAR